MYQNPFAAGFEVISKSQSYSVGSAGDIAATASHLATNNVPEYAAMFYQPSENEVFSSLRYKTDNPEYDSGLRDVQESLQGKPFEFYIPQSIMVPDGVGASTSEIIEKSPAAQIRKIGNTIIDEIERAQKKVISEVLVLRELEFEESITIHRRIKKRELILKRESVSDIRKI